MRGYEIKIMVHASGKNKREAIENAKKQISGASEGLFQVNRTAGRIGR